MFHLMAPIDPDPETRHHRAQIGVAFSKDLRNWNQIQPIWYRTDNQEWDSFTHWTGSVYRHDNKFYLFYTGRNKEIFWKQRIGYAVSKDLISWETFEENPILDAADPFYNTDNMPDSRGTPPAWRDPFVFFEPKSGTHIMLMAAQKAEPDNPYRACIGMARSTDLRSWELQAPLLAPDRYTEMEVPQLLFHNNLYYLFFSTKETNYSDDWANEVGAFNGWHCYVSNSMEGPYEPANGDGKVHSSLPLFNARLLDARGPNSYLAIGWLDNRFEGQFIGTLSPPVEVTLDDGTVKIEQI